MTASPTHQAIDAVWRHESARIVAALARMVRDLGLAEELAQDSLVIALEKWPRDGVPANPGAWLMATAKHRAIDRLRRRKLTLRKHEELGRELDGLHADAAASIEAAMDEDIGDDLLRLVFTACHPLLSVDAQVALTLRLLCGLTTDEIARAFLAPESTIAQRIVRAKRTLSKGRVPFEVPRGDARSQRLDSVLKVVYLIFNEGYAATTGSDLMRPALCAEALRLGRILAGLAPHDAEVHALVALMELQASRTAARSNSAGEPVLLLDQDRTRWDRLLVEQGVDSLQRARALAPVPGGYQLQAEIAACHARATSAQGTDWTRIVSLYSELARQSPSPIVELNRAVAVSMADGAAAALPLVDALCERTVLHGYHLLPAVRGDLLSRLGRHAEAREEFRRAAAQTRNLREQNLLLARAVAAVEQP